MAEKVVTVRIEFARKRAKRTNGRTKARVPGCLTYPDTVDPTSAASRRKYIDRLMHNFSHLVIDERTFDQKLQGLAGQLSVPRKMFLWIEFSAIDNSFDGTPVAAEPAHD